MAKKRRTFTDADSSQAPAPPDSGAAAVESKIEGFAEDLGRLLGTAQAKAEGWLGQRRLIADNLMQIRDTAQRLLGELTGESAAARRGRRAGGSAEKAERSSGAKKGRKRTMSPEARERIAAAQRARWARHKAGK